MINELVSRVFATRNAVHIEHWRTKSGYNHERLGALYQGLVDGIDELVEAYIGVFGMVSFDCCAQKPSADMIDALENDLIWISQNRDHIVRNIRAIDNILQNLEQTYLNALFNLKTKQ